MRRRTHTYGEGYVARKLLLKMVDGEWTTQTIPHYLIKPRMKKAEAIAYYSKKLDKIWAELYGNKSVNNSIKPQRRSA